MMHESLVEALAATQQYLDDLAQQHQEAEAYAATQERLAYLHDCMRQLLTEVTAFKHEALQNGQIARWQATCATLRAMEPAAFRTPAQALIRADPTLLDLIAYLSAARTCIRERRAWLAESSTENLPGDRR